MSLKTRVGRRLREYRDDIGLTQERLAEIAGRSVDTISAIERGVMLPGFETLERLAVALNVPLMTFFDAEGDEGEDDRAGSLAKLLLRARKLSDTDLKIAADLIAALDRGR